MPPKGSTTSTRSKDKERQATVSPAPEESPTPTPSRAISVQTPRHMVESSRELELRRTGGPPASGFTDSQLRELESMIANAVTQAVTTALRFKDPAPAPAPAPTPTPTYEPALQRVSVTDIGYFDPRLDESFGKGDIITHVDMPTEATTLSSFIRDLDLRKDTWFAIHTNYQDPQNRRPPLTQPTNRPWSYTQQRTLGPVQANYGQEEWQEDIIEADEA
ncbi:hypothetical protein HYFRA_00006433 [Hymenoscyphus fraxineus]|uniref:Uncharacterized protein n=1 Tax=Hymenoscyphus fraxineus TaxID=746836 RepID=A0A9N9PPG8_9HELO|nr:hypothetical protein HYFRA_00006433 [Hymenoscyphus fraxineus]